MKLSAARQLARQLMDDHGLKLWRLGFDRAKRAAGGCSYRRRRIVLSRFYVRLNSEDDVRNTILHEIAHALAGPGVGHGPKWKEVCRQIGARPERCYGSHIKMPKGRVEVTCPFCEESHYRHRRPRAGAWCSFCGPDLGRPLRIRILPDEEQDE